jgi:hypothetical protein
VAVPFANFGTLQRYHLRGESRTFEKRAVVEVANIRAIALKGVELVAIDPILFVQN